jgi:hypothetical protein
VIRRRSQSSAPSTPDAVNTNQATAITVADGAGTGSSGPGTG